MIEQGSAEWFASRLGKVTASKVYDVMAKTKSGYGAARKNYMMELLCQRLTGAREEGFTNAAMQRGNDLEPMARGRYEIENDLLVSETGLIDHPAFEGFAASPDGLVGDDGLIEIKCPNTATHIDFMKTGKINPRYQSQMTAQMLCTGREWCDFVSFDDRLPENLEYRVQRYELDKAFAIEMLFEVKKFLDELAALETDMTELAA
jgi:putative phage-type endonuclease